MSGLTSGMGIFTRASPPVSFGDGRFHMIPAFGNVGVVETSEGLVLFDLGLRQMGEKVFEYVRQVSDQPVKYVVFSHGHFDHCFGYEPFVREVRERGWGMPRVVAHQNIVARFEKYRRLYGYHVWLNSLQFGSLLSFDKPTEDASALEVLSPDVLVKIGEPFSFELGGLDFHLFPEMGETDDAVWMHVPEGEAIYAGDLFLWSFPNVGNPFKVQRYPRHWARALERMLGEDAKYLVPGHGPLVEGREKVREALSTTMRALDFVHDAVVERMNEGKWFPQIFEEVVAAYKERDEFTKSPYLEPIYGSPEFAVHATHRLYHGWYNSGNPTDLFPARPSAVASEVLSLVGPGAAGKVLSRARGLLDAGQPQLAMHLLDLVIDATPSGRAGPQLLEALAMKKKALDRLAAEETSFIARNVYLGAARVVRGRLRGLKRSKR
ncbi:MAG: alkyl sulfatase dimerization domain-containing protein [Promethearchaeota archaeon]